MGDELPADLRKASARLAKIQELQQQLASREQVRAQAAAQMREQAGQYLTAVADPDQRIPPGHVPPMVDPVGLAEAKLARAQALAARKAAARTRGYRQGQDWQPAPVVKAREALVAAREHAAQNPKSPPRRNSREHRATKADRINITDPESVTMISSKGWVQGYNTQLAVSADQVIVAVHVTDQPVDVGLLEPMMTAAQDAASTLVAVRPHGVDPRIGTVLADAGYLSKHNITCDGPDRLIAPGRARQSKPVDPHAPAPDKLTDPVGWMSARLRQPDTKTRYNQRGATVEPVNGHLKTIVRLRRFTCRGLQAAQTEATLAATALNIGKLIRHTVT